MKRLADGGLFLRVQFPDIVSLCVSGVGDKPALPLGLRYAVAVDGEAIPLLYPCSDLFVGRQFLRIKFALIVIGVDYEGEPGSVHRQTGFGNGVRIPFVCLSLTKKIPDYTSKLFQGFSSCSWCTKFLIGRFITNIFKNWW